MKKCNVCKVSKLFSEFNKNKTRSDGLQTSCRECSKARSQKYYQEHSEKHKQTVKLRVKQHQNKCRAYVFEYMKSHPCVDCGQTDVRVLEFDHVRGIKLAGVAKMITHHGYGLNKIIEEIAKCDVRCKNCHTIVTYERLGGTWHDNLLGLQA